MTKEYGSLVFRSKCFQFSHSVFMGGLSGKENSIDFDKINHLNALNMFQRSMADRVPFSVFRMFHTILKVTFADL